MHVPQFVGEGGDGGDGDGASVDGAGVGAAGVGAPVQSQHAGFVLHGHHSYPLAHFSQLSSVQPCVLPGTAWQLPPADGTGVGAEGAGVGAAGVSVGEFDGAGVGATVTVGARVGAEEGDAGAGVGEGT